MAQKPTGNTRDIAAQKRSKQEREGLQALCRRVVEAQENERRAVAGELHNVLGQSMTVLKLILDKAMHSPAEGVAPTLQEALGVVDEVVARVRNLSLELWPSMLDDLGLLPTLHWYCHHHAERSGVSVDFKHAGLDKGLSPDVTMVAFRIVQEGLTNAITHSGARAVSVRAWADARTLALKIEDKGAGFNRAAVQSGAHSGIKQMEERALSLGGTLSIDSQPGAGTIVTAELPLSRPREIRKVRIG